jgi:2-methylcitrate dehydratase PrpD
MIADIAEWAVQLRPDDNDLELARRALVDTVAVALAASDEPVVQMTAGLPEPLRWAAIGHALDFDDVHLPSSSHVSVVCVNATLSVGGGAREYLAAAGVMARIGTALGWSHYSQGWHTTCTAGAPAAAVAAGLILGLDVSGLARAMALAIPSAGGLQRAFGTAGKALQVGFATDAGVRAARLAAAGATAAPAVLDDWFRLMGGTVEPDLSGPAVPGGLAIKLHPCCYAMQRPISAVRGLPCAGKDLSLIEGIQVRTPQAGVQPLIHHNPNTGLEAKFSMEYAVATALVDEFPGMAEFTDASVNRSSIRALMERVEIVATPGPAEGVMHGETRIAVEWSDGTVTESALDLPYGHPELPASADDLSAKVTRCVGHARAGEIMNLGWRDAADVLRRSF